jgi:hypothetical protein
MPSLSFFSHLLLLFDLWRFALYLLSIAAPLFPLSGARYAGGFAYLIG